LGEGTGGDPEDFAFGFFFFAEGEIDQADDDKKMERGDDDGVPPEFRVVHYLGRGFFAVGHHSDLGDAGALEDVHDGNEALDGEIAVGADDDSGVGFFEFDGEEAGFEVLWGDGGFVEFEGIVAVDRDGEDLGGVDGAFGGGAFGDDEVEAVLDEGCGDHENDQEDEGKVEEGSDIDLRERLQGIPR
jgi:hypothetical protein